jgi:hypothetical protein
MAISPADVVVARSPKAGRDHDLVLGLLALLAAVVVIASVVVLVRWADDGSRGRPSTVTTVTSTPAPPIHRLGPAQPIVN